MKTPLSRSLASVTCLLLVSSACSLPFDGQDRREVAVLSTEHLKPPHLVLPDTVRAGETVTLTLLSGGPNGCYAPDRVEVRRSGDHLRVTPYNRVLQGVCTQAPVRFEHGVELRLDTPGVVVLEVVARSSLQSSKASVLLSKHIVVRS